MKSVLYSTAGTGPERRQTDQLRDDGHGYRGRVLDVLDKADRRHQARDLVLGNATCCELLPEFKRLGPGSDKTEERKVAAFQDRLDKLEVQSMAVSHDQI